MTKRISVLIYTTIPWNFPLDYLREYALALGKHVNILYLNTKEPMINSYKDLRNKGNRQYFLFSLRSYFSGTTVFIPFTVIPGKRYYFVRKANDFIMQRVRDILIWIKMRNASTFLYLYFPMDLQDIQKYSFDFTIYDSMEYPYADSDNKTMNQEMRRKQIALARRADRILVNSSFMASQYPSQKTVRVPSGFTLKTYRYKTVPKNVMEKIPHPIVGFITNTMPRLDVELLAYVAKHHPEMSFILIGPQTTDAMWFAFIEKALMKKFYRLWPRLLKLPNVYWLGQIPNSQRHDYLGNFDVGIIPYNVKISYVLYGNPIKAYEYLSYGKPVVSTRLYPLEGLQYIHIADTKEQFSQLLSQAVMESKTRIDRKARMKFAYQHDVSVKAKAVYSLLRDFASGVMK